MDIFSVSDKRPKDILYVMVNSFKLSKEDNTVINYYLIIEDVDDLYELYFEDLQSPDFNIIFLNARDYSLYINPPAKTYLYYVRCLAPRIFSHLDKIIYLDTDTVCINVGIELLWNMDLKNKPIAAATDILIQYNNVYLRSNTGNEKNYWNTGVMIMNLKQMREEGIDKEIEECLLNWPKDLTCVLYDQTLLNYIIKDNIKTLPPKWNNSILAMVKRDLKAYMDFFQTENLLQLMKNAVILHLKGPKPWLRVHSWDFDILPHRQLEMEIYYLIYHSLGKTLEF